MFVLFHRAVMVNIMQQSGMNTGVEKVLLGACVRERGFVMDSSFRTHRQVMR